jgi:hypothetical protein
MQVESSIHDAIESGENETLVHHCVKVAHDSFLSIGFHTMGNPDE